MVLDSIEWILFNKRTSLHELNLASAGFSFLDWPSRDSTNTPLPDTR